MDRFTTAKFEIVNFIFFAKNNPRKEHNSSVRGNISTNSNKKGCPQAAFSAALFKHFRKVDNRYGIVHRDALLIDLLEVHDKILTRGDFRILMSKISRG